MAETFTITAENGDVFQTTSCDDCGLGLPVGPLGDCHTCPPKVARERHEKLMANKAAAEAMLNMAIALKKQQEDQMNQAGSPLGEPEEAGVGSRLRRWSCSCVEHTVKGKVLPGPYAFRGAATVGYSVFCQFCDNVFTLEPETAARKRKSKLCGVHCPEGSHSHEA